MHWSTRTNSAVWPVPYAYAQPYHHGSGTHKRDITPAVAVIGIVYSLRVAAPSPDEGKTERGRREGALSLRFLFVGGRVLLHLG